MIEVAPTRMLSLGLSWGLPAALLVALVDFAVGSGRARRTNVVTIDEILAGPVGPAVLERTTLDSRTRRSSGAAAQAAELFRVLQGRGGGAIRKWNASAGRRPAYSERSGRPLPGAVDFAIEQGDILWLSG